MKKHTFLKSMALMLSIAVIFAFAGCGESRISTAQSKGANPTAQAYVATHVAFVESVFPIQDMQLAYAVEAMSVITKDNDENEVRESVSGVYDTINKVHHWINIGLDYAWFFLTDATLISFPFDVLVDAGIPVFIVTQSLSPHQTTQIVSDRYPSVNFINLDRDYLAVEATRNFSALGSSNQVNLIGIAGEEMQTAENELLSLGMTVNTFYINPGMAHQQLYNLIINDTLYNGCDVIVMHEWLGEIIENILQQYLGDTFSNYFNYSACQIVELITAPAYQGPDSYVFLFDLDDYRDQITFFGHDIINNSYNGMIYFASPLFFFF